jgi:hypothetical protein
MKSIVVVCRIFFAFQGHDWQSHAASYKAVGPYHCVTEQQDATDRELDLVMDDLVQKLENPK